MFVYWPRESVVASDSVVLEVLMYRAQRSQLQAASAAGVFGFLNRLQLIFGSEVQKWATTDTIVPCAPPPYTHLAVERVWKKNRVTKSVKLWTLR